MPFAYSLARRFNAMSIRVNAPYLPGVYGISNSKKWIYIGHSENIQDALMQHLMSPSKAIHGHMPTGFVFEVCYTEAHTGRMDRLVQEYSPICTERDVR